MDLFTRPFHQRLDHPPQASITDLGTDLQGLIAALPGVVFRARYDQLWKLDFISASCYSLIGYLSNELLGAKNHLFEAIVHPADKAFVHTTRWSAAVDNTPYEVSYRVITQAGDEKTIREIGRCHFEDHRVTAVASGFLVDFPQASPPAPVLNLQDKRLIGLHTIDLAIISNSDLLNTLGVVLEQLLLQFPVEAAGISLVHTKSGVLAPVVMKGGSLGLSQQLPYAAETAQRVTQTRKICHSELIVMSNSRKSTLHYIGLPILANHEKASGVLEIFHRHPIQLSNDDMAYLEALAGQAAVGIIISNLSHKASIQEAERNSVNTAVFEGWSRTLELRDLETKGHAQRVAELTVRLAKYMGVGDADQVDIFRGALLHDIGKMGIPDSILQKPGPLDANEQRIVRHHPELAYQLLSSIPGLSKSLDIPYCHHEKWDGSGYPRGLRGEEIPLAARIFSVADVWDALIYDRPYRKAFPADEALQYIKSEAGRHFDPQVVQAFLQLHSLDNPAFYP
jgi:HD-GYP domain-containing protein (c-di-GMP phosphodiesterase class II)